MEYGSLRPARTFFRFQVTMKGPVAVDDGGFGDAFAGVETGRSEGERGAGFVLELRNVRGREAEAARLWLGVFGEGFLEAELAFVFAIFLKRVDEKQVGTAGGEHPTAIGGDVKADYGFTESGDVGFRVDAETVEHTDVSLVGGDSNVAFFGRCRCREVVLRDVLLESSVDKLVAWQVEDQRGKEHCVTNQGKSARRSSEQTCFPVRKY